MIGRELIRSERNELYRGGIITDLSGINLSCENSEECADLSGSWLPNVDFSGSNLSGVDFSGSDLRDSIFYDSNLKNANFSLSELEGTQFRMDMYLGGPKLFLNHIPDIYHPELEKLFSEAGYKLDNLPDSHTLNYVIDISKMSHELEEYLNEQTAPALNLIIEPSMIDVFMGHKINHITRFPIGLLSEAIHDPSGALSHAQNPIDFETISRLHKYENYLQTEANMIYSNKYVDIDLIHDDENKQKVIVCNQNNTTSYRVPISLDIIPVDIDNDVIKTNHHLISLISQACHHVLSRPYAPLKAPYILSNG